MRSKPMFRFKVGDTVEAQGARLTIKRLFLAQDGSPAYEVVSPFTKGEPWLVGEWALETSRKVRARKSKGGCMRPRYSPGPWRAIFNDKIALSDGDGWPVAVFHDRVIISGPCHASERGSVEADVRLMTAAPELLEAAKLALDDFMNARRMVDTMAALKVAIDKAEGGEK